MPRHFSNRSRLIAEALAEFRNFSLLVDIPAALRQVDVPEIVILHWQILDWVLLQLSGKFIKPLIRNGLFVIVVIDSRVLPNLAWKLL